MRNNGLSGTVSTAGSSARCRFVRLRRLGPGVIALAALLVFAPRINAILPAMSFQEVTKSELCVVVKAVAVTKSNRKNFTTEATVAVERVVIGKTSLEQLQIPYGGIRYDKAHFEVGKRYVLFVSRYGPDPQYYAITYFSSGFFPIVNGDIKVVSKLSSNPKERELEAFLKEAVYVRGPEIVPKLIKSKFFCDENIAFDMTFTNPSAFPMKLAIPKDTGEPVVFDLVYHDSKRLYLRRQATSYDRQNQQIKIISLEPGASQTH